VRAICASVCNLRRAPANGAYKREGVERVHIEVAAADARMPADLRCQADNVV
jgi:hypothetical protein